MTAGINGRAVADAWAKEPDRVTSVELFILAPPVETVAPGSTPVGSSPPTPPPDEGQLAGSYVNTHFAIWAFFALVTVIRYEVLTCGLVISNENSFD